VEADIARCKRVIGDALRSRTEGRQTTEVAIAVASLNRMLATAAATASSRAKALGFQVAPRKRPFRRLLSEFAPPLNAAVSTPHTRIM